MDQESLICESFRSPIAMFSPMKACSSSTQNRNFSLFCAAKSTVCRTIFSRITVVRSNCKTCRGCLGLGTGPEEHVNGGSCQGTGCPCVVFMTSPYICPFYFITRFTIISARVETVVHVLAIRYYNFNIKPDPQCEQLSSTLSHLLVRCGQVLIINEGVHIHSISAKVCPLEFIPLIFFEYLAHLINSV